MAVRCAVALLLTALRLTSQIRDDELDGRRLVVDQGKAFSAAQPWDPEWFRETTAMVTELLSELKQGLDAQLSSFQDIQLLLAQATDPIVTTVGENLEQTSERNAYWSWEESKPTLEADERPATSGSDEDQRQTGAQDGLVSAADPDSVLKRGVEVRLHKLTAAQQENANDKSFLEACSGIIGTTIQEHEEAKEDVMKKAELIKAKLGEKPVQDLAETIQEHTQE